MSKYVYQVRLATGETSTGVLTASGLEEASRTLRGEGHVIVDLHEQVGAVSAPRRPRNRRVKRDEVIFFANQLAVMVDTGVPLPDALDSIAEQTNDERFRPILADICEQVKSGVEFSAALAKYPKIFGGLFVSLVRASEASGTMGKMLQRVARYLQDQRQVVKRVKGAVAYPMGMLCFCVAVVVGMLVFILPRFEKIYAGKSAAMPAPTRLLLGLSNVIVGYWPFILAGIALMATAACLVFRRPEGKIALDRARIDVPVLGGMFRKAALARSLRTLATMFATGVSMLESLEITADVAGNTYYARVWRGLGERLKEGATLSDEMYRFPLIPRSVAQMVAAGERTGKLDLVMDRVASFCEDDLETAIATMTSFIEPVMIVLMGVIVGGIALALLLPIFSLSKVVSG